MFIKNENIIIRSAKKEDVQIITDWWNDGSVMAHAGFPNGLNTTVEDVQVQINMNEGRLSQRCIIEINHIRSGGCHYRIDKDVSKIGIKICNDNYQNRGIGTKVLSLLIDFIFTDDEINSNTKILKIKLDTNTKNIRAQHVYEKIGFEKVRTNIDSWKDQLGKLQSSIDYEMTIEEYLKRNE